MQSPPSLSIHTFSCSFLAFSIMVYSSLSTWISIPLRSSTRLYWLGWERDDWKYKCWNYLSVIRCSQPTTPLPCAQGRLFVSELSSNNCPLYHFSASYHEDSSWGGLIISPLNRRFHDFGLRPLYYITIGVQLTTYVIASENIEIRNKSIILNYLFAISHQLECDPALLSPHCSQLVYRTSHIGWSHCWTAVSFTF